MSQPDRDEARRASERADDAAPPDRTRDESLRNTKSPLNVDPQPGSAPVSYSPRQCHAPEDSAAQQQ